MEESVQEVGWQIGMWFEKTLLALQNNAGWISAIGMFVFAGVQVLLMFAQGRQQIRLKRLELVQQLDEVAFEFDGSKESVIEVQTWLGKHQSICALLLKKKDAQTVIILFNYLMGLRRDMAPVTTQVAIERVHKFNALVNDVMRCLGTARYGFTKENMAKEKRK